MATIKDRMAKLNASAGGAGIPLPQMAGHRPASMRLQTHESSSSQPPPTEAPSEPLQGGEDTAVAAVEKRQSMDSVPPVMTEGSSKNLWTEVEEGSMNAVALSRPVMPTGARRRPSRVDNLVSRIPVQNRLSLDEINVFKDLEVGTKRTQDIALITSEKPDKELTEGEQWLLSRMIAMEKEFRARIFALEEETAILRKALVDSGVDLPPQVQAVPIPATPQSAAKQQPKTLETVKEAEKPVGDSKTESQPRPLSTPPSPPAQPAPPARPLSRPTTSPRSGSTRSLTEQTPIASPRKKDAVESSETPSSSPSKPESDAPIQQNERTTEEINVNISLAKKESEILVDSQPVLEKENSDDVEDSHDIDAEEADEKEHDEDDDEDYNDDDDDDGDSML